MEAQQFAYWLQGFAELNEQPPTVEQWKSIREHLALVFKKVTPAVGSPAIPDLHDSPAIKELLERARRAAPGGPILWPAQPYILRDSTGSPKHPPGTIIC